MQIFLRLSYVLNRWLANSSDPVSPLISNRLRLFQFDEGRTSSGQYISNYVFSPNFFENKSRIIKYSCHSEELSLYIDLPGYIGNFNNTAFECYFLSPYLQYILYLYFGPQRLLLQISHISFWRSLNQISD